MAIMLVLSLAATSFKNEIAQFRKEFFKKKKIINIYLEACPDSKQQQKCQKTNKQENTADFEFSMTFQIL